MLNEKYKKLLQAIAVKVQKDLSEKIIDKHLVPTTNPKVGRSDTFGWNIEIFKLKKTGGCVELWLDLFPNIGRPVICICYGCNDGERINKIACHIDNGFSDEHDTQISKKIKGHSTLQTPLAKKYFNRFLIEAYGWKYFSYYFFDEVNSKNKDALIKKIGVKTEWMLRATLGALEINRAVNEIYSAIENRKTVTLHVRRERNKKLADNAKLRDSFKCRVCEFNFQDTYGEIGRGFAEAHHVIALSKLKNKTETKLNDLITVCSNCHRMLHHMDGKANDHLTLRKRLKTLKK